MIISASRRTDIPAFYSEWFLNRLRDGLVYVRNPYNSKQISQINLSPEHIECIIFWTKNPTNIIEKLKEIESLGYNYYFQFTLTGYGKLIEKNVADEKYLIRIFKELSDKIGEHKIIWRYDPIILSNDITNNYHLESFLSIAEELKGYTQKCVFSFLDMYKKCEKNMKTIPLKMASEEEQLELARRLNCIARNNLLMLETCSERIDLEQIGIPHGRCVDDKLISKIIGRNLTVKKDPTQRNECGCVSSIDVGTYNTCKHNCLYCYANYNFNSVEKNIKNHDVNSPLLIGHPDLNDNIAERKINSFVDKQLNLFE